MKLHLEVIGIALVCLGLVHAIFPKYFNWKQELASLNLINRQMMQVHTFFIAFFVLLMGLLCATSAQDLITTPLGQKICLGLGAFWLVRLFFQLFGYSSKLWKGKRFETTVHIVFILFWAYMSWVFLKTGMK